jgi:hypothetical protein
MLDAGFGIFRFAGIDPQNRLCRTIRRQIREQRNASHDLSDPAQSSSKNMKHAKPNKTTPTNIRIPRSILQHYAAVMALPF